MLPVLLKVRAKLVVKTGSLYRLDPSRYPAGV